MCLQSFNNCPSCKATSQLKRRKINEMINIHIMLVALFPKEFNSAQLLKKLHNYLLLNLFVLTACEHKYMITTLPLIIGPDVVNK